MKLGIGYMCISQMKRVCQKRPSSSKRFISLLLEFGLTERFVSEVERNGAKRGILVYPEKLSSVAGKVSESSRSTWSKMEVEAYYQTITELAADYALEAFKESDLLVNITHHILVPKHSIMTQQEKLALLKR